MRLQIAFEGRDGERPAAGLELAHERGGVTMSGNVGDRDVAVELDSGELVGVLAQRLFHRAVQPPAAQRERVARPALGGGRLAGPGLYLGARALEHLTQVHGPGLDVDLD